MMPWINSWLYPKDRPSSRPSRPGRRARSRLLEVEELECRLTPSSGVASALNLPITTDPGVQQMPSIAVDPHDPQHLVVAYMDRSLVNTGYAGIGARVSHDGGVTWQQTTIPLPAGFDQGAADPIVRFDDQSHLFASFQATTFLGPPATLTSPISLIRGDLGGVRERVLGFQSNNGVFVTRSDDGGLTWDQPVAVVSHQYDGVNPVLFELYPDLAIDTFRTLPDGHLNPNYGNLYETWGRYYPSGQFPGSLTGTGGSDVLIAVSKDGGQTWQTQLQNLPGINVPVSVIQNPQNGPSIPGSGFTTFPHPTVGPDGDIYVGLWEGGDFAVQHSTDASASFSGPDFNSTNRLAFGLDAAVLNNAGLPNDNFRIIVVRQVAADPTRPGTVYAVETFRVTDASGTPIDGADVFFARSADYGVTWQRTELVGIHPAFVLNDDNDGQSASGQDPNEVIHGQALAHLAVDDQGNIGVIWYDTRRDPNDHNLDVFGTVSTDGGLTFSANFRVTDQSFDPDQGSFTDPTGQQNFYIGDATGLALANGSAYATWTDTRNGNQDVFFSRFAISPPPAPPNDRFEPNDTPAAATDLGRQLKLLVSKLALPAGDEDWFRVQAIATGNLMVTATEQDPGAGLQIELWNDSGTTRLAAGHDVLDADGHVIGQQVVFPGPSGQSYLIHLVAVGGGTARYSLQIASLTADLGTIVHNVQASTFQPGDQDYYLLSAGAAGSLEVKLTPGVGASGNFHLELLDANTLDVLATGSPGPGPDMEASLAVEQSQAVLVHLSGDTGTQGDFTLELTNLDQFSASQGNSLVFPAGDGPSKIAAGDLNGDNIADLVVSNFLENTVSVLLANGDGTFQAPRQFAIGAIKTTFIPGIDTQVLNFRQRRDVRLADFNGDHVLDVVVTNYDSGDISVLLGRGDGTFQTQRRFNATPNPLGLDIGDVNNDGKLDIVVIDSTPSDKANNITVLLGRGDGTFEPEKPFIEEPHVLFLANIRLADFNHDHRLDLAVGGGQQNGIDIYLGNGDGTFTYEGLFDGSRQSAGMVVADFNNDGNPDLAAANFSEFAGATVLLGNTDGTFTKLDDFFSGQGPDAIAVADFGSVIPGSTVLGPPDGNPDLILANSGQLTGTAFLVGGPGIVVLPGIYDAGVFKGFGDPYLVAPARNPSGLDVGDFNHDGKMDIAVADTDGVRVIFNQPPVISSGATPQTARNLGSVVHILEPTLTIVPGHEDAYFRLQAPTETASGSGDEVLDFSTLFAQTEGAGLQMEVRDISGNLLGSGARFRVSAAQGTVLLVHIFGVTGTGGVRGAGAYTLDIDVLPQLVSIESQALLPGLGPNPGGPTASLVLTFQGDRLDTASAEDPANYRVTWLGPDGLAGTADDRVIVIQSGTGKQSVVYDPSTNVNVASGNVYPTAIRQTVTLLFTDSLPAGSYRIELSPAIQTAAFNQSEPGLLASRAGLNGHPVVALAGSQVTEGARRTALDLVFAAGALGGFDSFQTGTPFLTQLHDDLGALLDAELSRLGDHPSISGTIDNQILDRFNPALGPVGQRTVGMLVIWLDPVSPTVIDSRGSRVVYNQQDSSFVNTISRAYANVTGNMEVIVLPFVATTIETFRLVVADVPASVRGGVIYFGVQGTEMRPLTAELRSGATEFLLSFGSALVSAPGAILSPMIQTAPGSQGNPDPTGLPQAAFTLVGTRVDSAAVAAVGPFFHAVPLTASSESGGAVSGAAARNTSSELANKSGGDGSPEAIDALAQQLASLYAETERTVRQFVGTVRAWLKVSRGQPPAGLPPMGQAGGGEIPIKPPPQEEEEDDPEEQIPEASDAQSKEDLPQADEPLPCFVYVIGLGASMASRALEKCDPPGCGPAQRPRRARTKDCTNA